MVHPCQNSNRISSVQSPSVGDVNVAVSSSVKLRGSVPATIRALAVSNSSKSCCWISAAANVAPASFAVQWVYSKSTWQFHCDKTSTRRYD